MNLITLQGTNDAPSGYTKINKALNPTEGDEAKHLYLAFSTAQESTPGDEDAFPICDLAITYLKEVESSEGYQVLPNPLNEVAAKKVWLWIKRGDPGENTKVNCKRCRDS